MHTTFLRILSMKAEMQKIPNLSAYIALPFIHLQNFTFTVRLAWACISIYDYFYSVPGLSFTSATIRMKRIMSTNINYFRIRINREIGT